MNNPRIMGRGLLARTWVAIVTSGIAAAGVVIAAIISVDAKHDQETARAEIVAKDARILEFQRRLDERTARPAGDNDLLEEIDSLRSENERLRGLLSQPPMGNRDTSTASGSRGIAPSPIQADGSFDPPSFETESYRLAVEGMKKSGKTVRITMMLEALDEMDLSFRAGRWYLLDENGERWNELPHDDAWVRHQRSGRDGATGAPPALMGVNLVSGTKVKDSLVFNATGSGQGTRFTLVGVESKPQSEREIILRDLVADKN